MHTQTIDIFLEVIDHYGDMGFVGVFVSEFLRRYPTEYHFRVFTDDEKTGFIIIYRLDFGRNNF